jgi:hypothetical protein
MVSASRNRSWAYFPLRPLVTGIPDARDAILFANGDHIIDAASKIEIDPLAPSRSFSLTLLGSS